MVSDSRIDCKSWCKFTTKVDENNIGAPKMQRSIFIYCDSSIGLFSIAPSKVVTLNLLRFDFGIRPLHTKEP